MSNEDRAVEYAEGMMGAKYEYFTEHADKMLFNTIKKSYLAGAFSNYAVDNSKHINALKPALIESLLRHDNQQSIEIVNLMFTPKTN